MARGPLGGPRLTDAGPFTKSQVEARPRFNLLVTLGDVPETTATGMEAALRDRAADSTLPDVADLKVVGVEGRNRAELEGFTVTVMFLFDGRRISDEDEDMMIEMVTEEIERQGGSVSNTEYTFMVESDPTL